MTTLADLSRYDPDDVADDYDGVILNIEDPNMAHKAEIAHAAGDPVILYSWVYPGDGGHSATRAAAAVELLATDGIPVASHYVFYDYEQAGVSPADVAAAVAISRQQNLGTGVYTYLLMLPEIAGVIGGVDLWIAFYPGNNDGSYPAWAEQTARATGAVLWQYTSSNGTRDLSRVLDDAWWARITGGAPAPSPAPTPQKKDDSMFIGVKRLDPKTGTCAAFWVVGGVTIRDFGLDNPKPWGTYGLTLPQSAFDFAARTGLLVEMLNGLEWAFIEARTVATTR